MPKPFPDMSPLGDRLKARIKINELTGCWEWQGSLRVAGYGQMGVWWSPIPQSTHRLAYMAWVGPLIPGMLVCHKCDNPPCCRPDHLFLGTVKDNSQDSLKKGRNRPPYMFGAENPAVVLTEPDVIRIRQRISAGEIARTIAEDFKVSIGTVYAIKKGRIWKQVP